MKYLQPTFTLPAAPVGVTQERWNEIFGPSLADMRKAVRALNKISVKPKNGNLWFLIDSLETYRSTSPQVRTSRKSRKD